MWISSKFFIYRPNNNIITDFRSYKVEAIWRVAIVFFALTRDDSIRMHFIICLFTIILFESIDAAAFLLSIHSVRRRGAWWVLS